MRVIRDGKCVKIVPVKYKPVLDGFVFESEKKRLAPTERRNLLIKLTRLRFSFRNDLDSVQMKYAKEKVRDAGVITFVKVKKRNHTEYRIRADETEISVSEGLIGDCPKEFLQIKHEF